MYENKNIKNGNSSIAVNDFSQVPFIPYNIVSSLIKNGSEDLWKLLKYQTIDALDRPSLTIKEKKDLIWDGSSNEQDFTIFFKSLIGNALDDSKEQMRLQIFRYTTSPITIINSNLIYEIDIITHEKCSPVRYNGIICERTDILEQEILSCLNGRDVGIGTFMAFDRQQSRSCQSFMNISNSKAFYGRSLFLSLNLITPTVGGDSCG